MDSLQKNTKSPLLQRLLQEVSKVPGLKAHIKEAPRTAADALLSLCADGATWDIALRVRKELYPRDARELLWQLKHEKAPLSPAWLIVAERLSEGAKALLMAERVGFFTADGALFLSLNGLYLRVEKVAKSAAAPRVLRSLFTAARARVLQVLLLNPYEHFTITELSAHAQTAAATVSSVLGALERLEWLERRGKGPAKRSWLTAPGALLDEWVQALPKKSPYATHDYFVPGYSSPEGLQRAVFEALNRAALSYVVTGTAAAEKYAPTEVSFSPPLELCMTPSEIHGQGTPLVFKTLRRLGAQEVTKGINLRIIERPDADCLPLGSRFEDSNFVNTVQVYLHLLLQNSPAHLEQAKRFRKEVLEF